MSFLKLPMEKVASDDLFVFESSIKCYLSEHSKWASEVRKVLFEYLKYYKNGEGNGGFILMLKLLDNYIESLNCL